MPPPGHVSTSVIVVLIVGAGLLFACASQLPPNPAEQASTALLDFRKAVLATIHDDARARDVSALVVELDVEDRRARDSIARYRERLRALDANYDASVADFDRLFSEFNNERLAQQNRITQCWIRIAQSTNDSEWQTLAPARIAAAKAILTPS